MTKKQNKRRKTSKADLKKKNAQRAATKAFEKKRRATQTSANDNIKTSQAVNNPNSLKQNQLLNQNQLKAHLLYRNDFNKLARYVSAPLYIYGSFMRSLTPDFYNATTDALENITTKLNIPYDVTFQNHYLGSFAGALTLTTLTRDCFFSLDSRKHSSKDSKGIIPPEKYADYCDVERSSNYQGIAMTGIALTVWETNTAILLPNRTFDYGDMAAYTLAFSLYAAGSKIAATKAVKRFAASPKTSL